MNETEATLHAEALKREAVKFGTFLIGYIDKNFTGISKALVTMIPAKFIDMDKLYAKFKAETK